MLAGGNRSIQTDVDEPKPSLVTGVCRDDNLLGGADKHQEKLLALYSTRAVHILIGFTFRSFEIITRKPAQLINRGTDNLENNLQAGGMKLEGNIAAPQNRSGPCHTQ